MMAALNILEFWFETSGPSKWFKQSDAFDAQIRGQFEVDAIEVAATLQRKGAHKWEDHPGDCLALILMLDQFPRNMYRGTKAMFVWDDLALTIAKRAVAKGYDLKTAQEWRAFYYMPYMHSENADDQSECVYLVDRGIDDPDTLFHAKAHRRVIERFGRFPHRNAVLDRLSTSEEQKFLADGGYSP